MEYDHIIVGAGSAGCVMAHRLSADPSSRVLLLEAGGPDRNPFIHMPAGLWRLRNNRRINWNYYTEPEPQLHDRRLYWPRGRVLGGSSSINAMCYCRGHPRDYDDWARQGASGWGWEDVLPYFLRSEDQQRGPSALHAVGGPLSVGDLRYTSPLSEVFLHAAEQAGHTRTDDFNGPQPTGFGYYQVTQRKGRRCSSAVAYLRSAENRPNLTVLTHARALRVLMDGTTAIGVSVSRQGREMQFFAAETLLCGGTVNSPHLLMLSGIGPADHLRGVGVNVVADLPGVGANLQDHLDIGVLVRCQEPVTYDALNKTWTALRYFLCRRGPGTSNIAEAGSFIVSRHATDERPDIQMHFLPGLLDDHGRRRVQGHGMTLHACPLRPESRGEIRLCSADPLEAPAISPGYLTRGSDMKMMQECLRLSLEVFRQPAFEPYRLTRVFPEPDLASDDDMADFIRRKSETIYHPVGTCRMGLDSFAVVDPRLRVHGIGNLRVVDASVMPALISANTNAATIMIAEKCADEMTLERAADH